MEKTRFRLEMAPFGLPARQSVLPFCLLCTLFGACSYDAGKLRALAPRAPDGAIDTPVSFATDVVSDLATSADVAIPDEVSLTIDVDSASETPVPDDGADSRDVPFANDDAGSGDVPVPPDLIVAVEVSGGDGGAGGGTGGTGTGGSSSGGDGPGGADGGQVGGADTAAGGTGGADGGGTGGADTAGGETGGGETGGAGLDGGGMGDGGDPGPDPDLVLWYKFDESNGTIAADSAMFGGLARNAKLATIGTGASAVFSSTRQVGSHAVDLTPSTSSPGTNGAYVTVPSLSALAPNDITIAVWVQLRVNTATQTWERIFDYGSSPTGMNWLNLMARSGDAANGPVEFAMSNIGHDQTQALISQAALSANVWHHIAIVLPAGTTYTGTMYIDGVAVATNRAMTLHMSDIGATSNNWLGRSQFSADPFFNGSLDDFRVYKRALSQQEITALFAIR